ncbi:OLC1v1025879C1 [Oldenlandia corymbosa var. corymbosa]|uniref:OLC1v1025879C1 n=1 Tax=Oldenlandia corymbosa var. corymbosa TaxID=529605 RepID=A0AAV1C8T3_OLDCO|nr:OLC1v1025879C1 [Oldenlandia corymbosa var. corymbosa]
MKVDLKTCWGDGNQWRRGTLLGKGGHGAVFLGLLSSYNPPRYIAVKSADASKSKSLKAEKKILSYMVGSPYIIQCYGEETTTRSDGNLVYNLLLEYGSGGSLATRIHSSPGNDNNKMSELEVRWYTISILQGLFYIHEVGFVHCDLKPGNILLVPWRMTPSGKVLSMAKICDFGLAKKAAPLQRNQKRKRESEKTEKKNRWRGTVRYLSPEAVRDGVQEPASDMWALGCVVLEMLSGQRPWEVEHQTGGKEAVLEKIRKGDSVPEIPGGISSDARDFLRCCLRKSAANRSSAKTLLLHPFVNNLQSYLK